MEEDAITLWLMTLRNSLPNDNPANPDMFQLLPTAVQQLATNLDLLGQICQVMESYVLLDSNRVLQVSVSFQFGEKTDFHFIICIAPGTPYSSSI
jgi:hypothetical protein